MNRCDRILDRPGGRCSVWDKTLPRDVQSMPIVWLAATWTLAWRLTPYVIEETSSGQRRGWRRHLGDHGSYDARGSPCGVPLGSIWAGGSRERADVPCSPAPHRAARRWLSGLCRVSRAVRRKVGSESWGEYAVRRTLLWSIIVRSRTDRLSVQSVRAGCLAAVPVGGALSMMPGRRRQTPARGHRRGDPPRLAGVRRALERRRSHERDRLGPKPRWQEVACERNDGGAERQCADRYILYLF